MKKFASLMVAATVATLALGSQSILLAAPKNNILQINLEAAEGWTTRSTATGRVLMLAMP
jgi:hypothetical protein